jgi:hypothetical protein
MMEKLGIVRLKGKAVMLRPSASQGLGLIFDLRYGAGMSFQERQYMRIGAASLMAVVGLAAIAVCAYAATYAAPTFEYQFFMSNSAALGWMGAVWFAFNALFVVPLFGSTVKQFLREKPGHEKSRYVLSSLR